MRYFVVNSYPDGTSVEHLFDSQNQYVGRKDNGVLSTQYVHDLQGRINAVLNSSGVMTRRYVYGTRSNSPDLVIAGTTAYLVITDQLGSIRYLVNVASGNIVERIEYDEFGRVILDTNRGFQSFAFAGGLYNAKIVLFGFGARDYNPEIGRWLQKDPIGFAGGDTNLYGYVVNDPVNFIDPFGLSEMPTAPINSGQPPPIPFDMEPNQCPVPDRNDGKTPPGTDNPTPAPLLHLTPVAPRDWPLDFPTRGRWPYPRIANALGGKLEWII